MTKRWCCKPLAGKSGGQLKVTSVDDVAGLFFPQLADLGIRVEATVSPKVERKMVYAGANETSFQNAQNALAELAELSISAERVRRSTSRHGKARVQQTKAITEAFLEKSIPDQLHQGPAEATPPSLAVVMSDGGRYQLLDRGQTDGKSESHWKESRIAALLSMQSATHEEDPEEELPGFLQDVCIARTLAEIGSVAGENPQTEAELTCEEPPWQRPTMLSKDVVASRCSWEEFGPQVASRAWHQGFFKSQFKVFVSDGSVAIEEMQARWFGEFTSVLDLMHALSYSLAAARALEDDADKSWEHYRRFATAIWQGRVDAVVSELEEHQKQIDVPQGECAEKDRHETIRRTIVYYKNHRSRMDYPEYRKRGFPLTSSIMESTVKQVSRRVKGSEKFWSSEGAESLLQLRADYLSDTQPMKKHWKSYQQAADGTRNYTAA